MKKKIILGLIFICLIAVVYARIQLTPNNKTTELNNTQELQDLKDMKYIDQNGERFFKSDNISCNLEECDPVKIGTVTWKPKPYWQNCTKIKIIIPECDLISCVKKEINISMQDLKNYEDIIEQECINYERVYFTNDELLEQRNRKEDNLRDRFAERGRLNREKKEAEAKELKVQGGQTETFITKK